MKGETGFFKTILDRFAKKRPVPVCVRAIFARLMPDAELDRIFHETAEVQYERTLLFSTVMRLMFLVTTKTVPSLRQAYQAMADEIPVSLAAVYQKVNHLEPGISEALVRHSASAACAVTDQADAAQVPLVKGLRTLIVDGDHFAATEHRLMGTRDLWAGPLPGFALAIYDPQYAMVVDMLPCEDAHAQERLLLGRLARRVSPNDLWLADRNFCTRDFLSDIIAREAFFVIRHHGKLEKWTPEGESRHVASIDTGEVYEQPISIVNNAGEVISLRRISVRLFEKTRDGDDEIHLLTNVPSRRLSAKRACEIYRKRWKIETLFLELTTSLAGEIDTLGYPKAAIFAFALAVIAGHAVALLKSLLSMIHGRETIDANLSWYSIYVELSSAWDGMEAILPPEFWSTHVGRQTIPEFTEFLLSLCRQIPLSRHQKTHRGPKKPVKKKFDRRVNHTSTARTLEEQKKLRKLNQTKKKAP